MAEYRVNYTQSNFTGGIVSAELYGRNDFNKVKSGLKQCKNWTIREAGGLEFRRGTKYLAKIPVELTGENFKTTSLGEVLFIFGIDGIRWLKEDNTFGFLKYPDVVPDLDCLQFTELKRRLYFYDGKMKLCQVELETKVDSEGSDYFEPIASVTKFEGELPNEVSVTAETIPASWPSTEEPTVQVDYQYAVSVSKDENHETIALTTDPVKANVELGGGDDGKSQRIELMIKLPPAIVESNTGGKVLIYRKYQGKYYYLDSVFLEDFVIPSGETDYKYTYKDTGRFSPDVSRAIKQKPEYLESDGSVIGVNSIADYGQRVFMTIQGFGTNIIFTQVGNTDSLAYSELRNEDEAGFLEIPVSHFDNWCKVVSGLDLIFSTSYTVSQIQGYGDLQLQTILFDGFSKTVQPVSTRRSMIYTNSSNRNIYDLTYNEYGQYDGIDLTLLVKYIFEQKTIKRLAFKDYPVKTIYVLCDDGDLYCLTYIKDQNIYAWYQIVHYGKIHDLIVVNRDTEDDIYLAVNTKTITDERTFGWHNRDEYNSVFYDSISQSFDAWITPSVSTWKYYRDYDKDQEYEGVKYYAWSTSEGGTFLTVKETPNKGDSFYKYEEGVVYQVPGSISYTNVLSDTIGDVTVLYYVSLSGTKICQKDQADNVISLYESEHVSDYVVFDKVGERFWGLGYTGDSIPVYVLEKAYHRTDDVYMDSVVRVTPLGNTLTGLDMFEGKQVRVFDLVNNRFYGHYDIQNPKTIEEGGNTIQIDDLDFDGFTVTEGKIVLPDDITCAGDVLVGLPYYAVMETIPLEFSDQNGNSTIGRKKTITDAYLRYGDSRGVSYKTLGKEYDCGIAKKDTSDSAEFLERGQIRLDVNSEYKWDSTIKILQRQPYPARIESITLGLNFNDKS